MRHAKKLLVSAVLITACYLGFSSYTKIQQKKQIDRNIKMLPPFAFRLSGGKYTFTNADLAPRKHLLIAYFNPSCDHCQYMGREIGKKKSAFRDYQLLFVTLADDTAVARYRENYALTGDSNVVFLQDTKMEFENIFGAGNVPSFFVYNRDHNLVSKVLGAAKVDRLIID